MSFEELKRYDAFDEDSAKEFIDKNYTTKTMSAFCDSISHDLPYIDTPHAKLLDMMKLAQLDTLNSSINLSAIALMTDRQPYHLHCKVFAAISPLR